MLTPRQAELLAFIKRYMARQGYAPSFEEMRSGLSLASKSTVSWLLTELEGRDFIRRAPNLARTMTLTSKVGPWLAHHGGDELCVIKTAQECEADADRRRDAVIRKEAYERNQRRVRAA